MAAPNVAAAPTAQPSVALAAAPTFAAGPPAVALAAAPTVAAGPPAAAVAAAAGPPALAAVSNSTLSIPSSGGRTRVRVRGPGLLGSVGWPASASGSPSSGVLESRPCRRPLSRRRSVKPPGLA